VKKDLDAVKKHESHNKEKLGKFQRSNDRMRKEIKEYQ
jgi:hypothetical protein